MDLWIYGSIYSAYENAIENQSNSVTTSRTLPFTHTQTYNQLTGKPDYVQRIMSS